MPLGRGRARRPMLQRRRLTRTTHLPEIERRTGRWRVGPQCLNERRRCITPRRVPPLELPPHMGSATTAPARSTNYVVNHMCEHICEPIHSTGRILPGEPSITMCGENTAYDQPPAAGQTGRQTSKRPENTSSGFEPRFVGGPNEKEPYPR